MSRSTKTNTQKISLRLPSLALAFAGVAALATLPAACQSGGVGDPCVPEDERDPMFSGFDMSEESIESRSFQCQTRICLVNHFQGRTSCPLGQLAPTPCGSPDDTSCGEGRACVLSAELDIQCDPSPEVADSGCPQGAVCDAAEQRCKLYVCHTPGNCQRPGATEQENAGKACCAPGTDTPISASVCGQCAASSDRSAERAVYCSCRCGPPEGEAPDDSATYCECPSGFECSEIRKHHIFGGKELEGKYCVRQGSAFEGPQECGVVQGSLNQSQCEGAAAELDDAQPM